jgi:hypothetical protein
VSGVLDLGGVPGSGGGDDTDQPTQAQVIAAQTTDEAAQGIVTHEGTVTAPFVFSYNGATMSFVLFQQVIADGAMYAALNASSVAAASITWNN